MLLEEVGRNEERGTRRGCVVLYDGKMNTGMSVGDMHEVTRRLGPMTGKCVGKCVCVCVCVCWVGLGWLCV